MDIVSNLATGFATALSPINLVYCFLGGLLGTLVGVLPGLGPVATIAMLLPATFGLPPELALIMLAGIYYGAQYGGSTTAILINLPGEPSSVVTALDGYQDGPAGPGGPALSIAAIGLLLRRHGRDHRHRLPGAASGQRRAEVRRREYFSLMVLGLVAAVVLAQGSLVKALGMVVLGLLLGLVGTDVNSGHRALRLRPCRSWPTASASSPWPWACSASPRSCATSSTADAPRVVASVGGLLPSREDLRRIGAPILRGTALGSLLGILPGGGALLASFAAYPVEKKVSPRSAGSARARSRGWPRRSRPTTPARRPRSFPC